MPSLSLHAYYQHIVCQHECVLVLFRIHLLMCFSVSLPETKKLNSVFTAQSSHFGKEKPEDADAYELSVILLQQAGNNSFPVGEI